MARKPTKRARPAKRKATPADWKPAFLDALAEGGIIGDACKAAGVCRDTFYTHRDADRAFAKAVRQALLRSVDGLEDEARRRAMNGSDKLLMMLLRANRRKYRPRKEVEHRGRVTVSAAEELTDDQLAAIAAGRVAGGRGGRTAPPAKGAQ
jgi:hypothetical protein